MELHVGELLHRARLRGEQALHVRQADVPAGMTAIPEADRLAGDRLEVSPEARAQRGPAERAHLEGPRASGAAAEGVAHGAPVGSSMARSATAMGLSMPSMYVTADQGLQTLEKAATHAHVLDGLIQHLPNALPMASHLTAISHFAPWLSATTIPLDMRTFVQAMRHPDATAFQKWTAGVRLGAHVASVTAALAIPGVGFLVGAGISLASTGADLLLMRHNHELKKAARAAEAGKVSYSTAIGANTGHA